MIIPISKTARFLLLQAIILLLSCTKDPEIIDSKRLTKVYSEEMLLHQIEYDSQLQMISMESFFRHYHNTGGPEGWEYWSELVDFEYQDGNLVKVRHKAGYDVLEYNSESLLTLVTLYAQDGTKRGEYQYQYDSMNRLRAFGGTTLEFKDKNVSQYRYDTYFSGEHVYALEYDDMKNPFSVLGAYFLTRHTEGVDIPSILSSNNVTNTKGYEYGGDSLYFEVDHQYQYDADGYPVWKSWPKYYQDTLLFEYEDY